MKPAARPVYMTDDEVTPAFPIEPIPIARPVADVRCDCWFCTVFSPLDVQP